MNLFPARRILIPLDFTSVSEFACAWARMFSAPGSRLEALYVHETAPAPIMGLPPAGLSTATRARVAARLRASFPGAATSVEEGDPALVVARRARRADLVVMASHGRRGLERALMGSVCEAVVRDSPAPVLAARSAPKRVRSVLAPVNLMPYSGKGLELAAQAAAFLGAELVVLNVSRDRSCGPNPRFLLNGLLARLPEALRAAIRPRVILRAGDAVPEILAESRRHGLVVVTAHRKSLLRDLVIGTTAERILRHSPVPVLAAPSGR